MTDNDIISKGRKTWQSWLGWKKDLKKNPTSYSFTHIECEIIREAEYKCCSCGKNIFNLSDFPVIRDNDVYCDNCEIEEFYEICELCEENSEIDDDSNEPFPKNPFFYNSNEKQYNRTKDIFEIKPSGIYEAIEYPIWTSDMFSCDIHWDNVQLVCTEEEFLKEKKWNKDNFPSGAEHVCNDCYETAKRIRKENK